MVTIRLARGGSKNRPFYHIIVADSRQPRDGRYIERLGYYNPIATGHEVPLEITTERVEYWLSQGAQISEQVKNLLKKAKKAATQLIQAQQTVDQTEAIA
jgi:small subunit ribosomal protein S16